MCIKEAAGELLVVGRLPAAGELARKGGKIHRKQKQEEGSKPSLFFFKITPKKDKEKTHLGDLNILKL